jgi:predicted nucleotidyltransferase
MDSPGIGSGIAYTGVVQSLSVPGYLERVIQPVRPSERAAQAVRGRMGIDEGLIREIVGRIRNLADPHRIILFGSAAVGQMTRDSDIDLLVVERSPGDARREGVRLRAALRGLGHPFDVLVMTSERYEESKDVIGGIAYPAHKYGKVIYEAT